MINQMIMEFDLKADKTMTCLEKTPASDAEYTGEWTFDGENVELIQKTMNGRPESDEMTGVIRGEGKYLNMVHHQPDGGELRFIFIKE